MEDRVEEDDGEKKKRMEERKRGLMEEKTRARGRKFRSKTTHNPFLRWTEQDDAALIHASILSSLSYPWSAGQCYAFVSLERERHREDPPRFPICIHTAITSFPPFFRIFLERKRERERGREDERLSVSSRRRLSLQSKT